MNTNPDDPMLAFWLDDELQGEELAAFEAGPGRRAEHLAAREEVRRWRALMAAAVPASLEPPYPEFFNTRVERAIRDQTSTGVIVPKWRFFGRSVLLPLAACAGMVLAFWFGTQTANRPPETVQQGIPQAIPVEPFVYTPESGVKAERFASPEASATVIVLDGVAAIPDATDFTKKSAALPDEREGASTADIEGEGTDSLGL